MAAGSRWNAERGASIKGAFRRALVGAAWAEARFLWLFIVGCVGFAICVFLFGVALAGIFGMVTCTAGPGGFVSGPDRWKVTNLWRIGWGALFGLMAGGGLSGFSVMRRLFFPRGGDRDGARRDERAAERQAPPLFQADDPMWDRELDG